MSVPFFIDLMKWWKLCPAKKNQYFPDKRLDGSELTTRKSINFSELYMIMELAKKVHFWQKSRLTKCKMLTGQ